MRKKLSLLMLSALLLGAAASAQTVPAHDSMTSKGITLIFINKDTAMSAVTRQKMIDAFYTVYPQEMSRFNADALKRVTFMVDTAYKGVAATGNGVVRYNPKWLHDHPEDIDVVTHEVMHIVQSYGRSAGPGWLTEGIADYVRYTFGVNNLIGKWALPDYKEGQNYTNSYRITARFLVWIEQQGHPNVVTELDKSLRAHTYTPEIWAQQAGKPLDDLWADYVKNPGVKLAYR